MNYQQYTVILIVLSSCAALWYLDRGTVWWTLSQHVVDLVPLAALVMHKLNICKCYRFKGRNIHKVEK